MKTIHQIVIVEDDTDLNSGLCKALKEEGRNIVSCENLRSAREQIFLSVPSLVILDINLPDGNGLTLLKEIRFKIFYKPEFYSLDEEKVY